MHISSYTLYIHNHSGLRIKKCTLS